MKRLLSILLLIAGGGIAQAYSQTYNAGVPILPSLYQQDNADRLLLVIFSDQSINSIPDSASANFYRKRGDYQTTTWSEHVSDNIAADHHLTKLTEWPMTELGMHCVVYQISASEKLSEKLQLLAHDTRVEIVQRMHYFKTQSHHYNDPYFKLQANLQEMQIALVHPKTTGRKVTIAMIDTGVDLEHPDLVGQVADNQNFAKEFSASFTSDKHGTAVAGIMVAKKDNATGITGIAPDAKLIALKACWPDQDNGIAAVCNSLTLALAINAAIRADVDILNMSLTGPDDPLLAVLLNKAIAKGLLVVAANPSDGNPDARFPASLKDVIAVNSWPLSPQAQQVSAEPVAAPGEKVLTTLPQGTYDFISGSSIAAAEVSGIIALLLELKPDLSLTETKQVLQKATSQPNVNSIAVVNASTAVLALCQTTECPQEMLSLLAWQAR